MYDYLWLMIEHDTRLMVTVLVTHHFKMEVLYQIRIYKAIYLRGISPYIALKNWPYAW